ncbi:MAG: TraB/GumN family protein [Hyphomonadaceae bacterium]
MTLFRGIALLLCLAVIQQPAAHAQPAPSQTGLPMWVVRDADSTIYITGTVHLLRDNAEWMSPKLKAALEASSELRLELAEVASAEALQTGIRALLPEFGAYAGPPITSLLTPEENVTLAAQLAAAGVPGDAIKEIDTHQPWFAVVLLGRDTFAGGAYKFVNGIDNVLARWAVAHGIPVKGMESLKVQIALTSNSTFDAQMATLRYKLKPSPLQQKMNERVVDAAFGSWLRGETNMTEAIVAFMRVGAASTGGTDALLKNRNEAWAGVIEDMLKGSGVSFIAVGAAHLVGPDNLQTRLKLRGITTERY